MVGEPQEALSAKDLPSEGTSTRRPVVLPEDPASSDTVAGGGAKRAVISVSREEAVFFAGPLPLPSILKQYNEIVPGAADRIIKQAEAQTSHRIKLERLVIDSDIRRADRGLWAGLAVAVVSIAGGCALVFTGHDWAGATIATATVVSLVTVFVYGSQSRRQERKERAKLMAGERAPAKPIADGRTSADS